MSLEEDSVYSFWGVKSWNPILFYKVVFSEVAGRRKLQPSFQDADLDGRRKAHTEDQPSGKGEARVWWCWLVIRTERSEWPWVFTHAQHGPGGNYHRLDAILIEFWKRAGIPPEADPTDVWERPIPLCFPAKDQGYIYITLDAVTTPHHMAGFIFTFPSEHVRQTDLLFSSSLKWEVLFSIFTLENIKSPRAFIFSKGRKQL